MAADFQIRPAIDEDYSKLPAIEKAAAQLFILHGLPEIADAAPAPTQSYRNISGPNVVFVVTFEQIIIGFCVVRSVDRNAYLKELSVCPSNMRKGVAGKLIRAAVDWALQQNFLWLTLTTFADISFNAPFYEKRGFEKFNPDHQWPGLNAILHNEIKIGLAVSRRVALRIRTKPENN